MIGGVRMIGGRTATVPTAAVRGLSVLIGAASDHVVTRAAGHPARLRIGLEPRQAATGRVSRLDLTLADAAFGGLTISRLTIRARDARLTPTWPPRLQTGRVRVRVAVDQRSLDAWLRRTALPIRLHLGAGGLTVRAGLGGLRLGDVRASVEVEGRALVVTPLHGKAFGLGLAVPPLRVALPVPPLPLGSRLVSVEITDGRATIELEAPQLDEPIDRKRLALARRVLARTAKPEADTVRAGPTRRRARDVRAISGRGSASDPAGDGQRASASVGRSPRKLSPR